uniref:Uncharacterized protein n=1 Tax=Rhizophora mucronata TaxID=61149 RepID=A0A2P2PSD6_RHIMU
MMHCKYFSYCCTLKIYCVCMLLED